MNQEKEAIVLGEYEPKYQTLVIPLTQQSADFISGFKQIIFTLDEREVSFTADEFLYCMEFLIGEIENGNVKFNFGPNPGDE